MKAKANLLTLLAAAVGGTIGYFAFFFLARQGYYALALPGGLLGIAAGWVGGSSKLVAILCGIAALCLGIFCEWQMRPFAADASLPYFLSHLHKLDSVTLIMIAIGTAIGFWSPFRRSVGRK